MPRLSSRLLVAALAILGTFSFWMFRPGAQTMAGEVEYTWTLSALGQGGWLGGPLFEDGSAGGGGALSIQNGRIIARFTPTEWTENASDEITVCFDVSVLKGSAPLPPEMCFGPAEVTGTPIRIPFAGSDHVFRITENH